MLWLSLYQAEHVLFRRFVVELSEVAVLRALLAKETRLRIEAEARASKAEQERDRGQQNSKSVSMLLL